VAFQEYPGNKLYIVIVDAYKLPLFATYVCGDSGHPFVVVVMLSTPFVQFYILKRNLNKGKVGNNPRVLVFLLTSWRTVFVGISSRNFIKSISAVCKDPDTLAILPVDVLRKMTRTQSCFYWASHELTTNPVWHKLSMRRKACVLLSFLGMEEREKQYGTLSRMINNSSHLGVLNSTVEWWIRVFAMNTSMEFIFGGLVAGKNLRNPEKVAPLIIKLCTHKPPPVMKTLPKSQKRVVYPAEAPKSAIEEYRSNGQWHINKFASMWMKEFAGPFRNHEKVGDAVFSLAESSHIYLRDAPMDHLFDILGKAGWGEWSSVWDTLVSVADDDDCPIEDKKPIHLDQLIGVSNVHRDVDFRSDTRWTLLTTFYPRREMATSFRLFEWYSPRLHTYMGWNEQTTKQNYPSWDELEIFRPSMQYDASWCCDHIEFFNRCAKAWGLPSPVTAAKILKNIRNDPKKIAGSVCLDVDISKSDKELCSLLMHAAVEGLDSVAWGYVFMRMIKNKGYLDAFQTLRRSAKDPKIVMYLSEKDWDDIVEADPSWTPHNKCYELAAVNTNNTTEGEKFKMWGEWMVKKGYVNPDNEELQVEIAKQRSLREQAAQAARLACESPWNQQMNCVVYARPKQK
jgi:hypothetical protein